MLASCTKRLCTRPCHCFIHGKSTVPPPAPPPPSSKASPRPAWTSAPVQRLTSAPVQWCASSSAPQLFTACDAAQPRPAPAAQVSVAQARGHKKEQPLRGGASALTLASPRRGFCIVLRGRHSLDLATGVPS